MQLKSAGQHVYTISSPQEGTYRHLHLEHREEQGPALSVMERALGLLVGGEAEVYARSWSVWAGVLQIKEICQWDPGIQHSQQGGRSSSKAGASN